MFVYSLTVQDGLHESALHSGLAITPFALTFLIGTFVTPRLFARYGRTVFLVGGVVQSLAMASLAAVLVSEWPHVSLLDLEPSLAVAGFVDAFIFVSAFRRGWPPRKDPGRTLCLNTPHSRSEYKTPSHPAGHHEPPRYQLALARRSL
jgi:MFS family permease